MGLTYNLVNIDKKEILTFEHINTGTKFRELTGTNAASAIVTYYMLENAGDRIAFVNESDKEIKLFGTIYQGSWYNDYKEVTEEVVQGLIENNIFRNNGKVWIGEEDGLYYWDLENVWDDKAQNTAST